MSRFNHSAKTINRVKSLVKAGLTYEQISERLGYSRGAIAGIMHRYGDTEVIDMSKATPEEAFDKIMNKAMEARGER
jgi:hypothetical protein